MKHYLEQQMRLFEFEDQKWFPKVLRQWQMDYIRFSVQLLNPYQNLKRPWERDEPPKTWVDLATGSGGPVQKLHSRWTSKAYTIDLFRTDLYPANEEILALDLRSDAYVSADFYTLFNAFHHFGHEDQLSIMKKMSLAQYALIAEPLDRNPLTFLGVFLLTGPGSFILSPFVKPFSWFRMFWTYIIPVVPLVTCWDGLVSVLRTPPLSELNSLAEKASNEDFKWRAESISFPFGRVQVLVGKRLKKK